MDAPHRWLEWTYSPFPPGERMLRLPQDVEDPSFRNTTFDELAIAYKEQTKGLIDGGADCIIVETIFDTLNAKAAVFAVREWVSVSRLIACVVHCQITLLSCCRH